MIWTFELPWIGFISSDLLTQTKWKIEWLLQNNDYSTSHPVEKKNQQQQHQKQ